MTNDEKFAVLKRFYDALPKKNQAPINNDGRFYQLSVETDYEPYPRIWVRLDFVQEPRPIPDGPVRVVDGVRIRQSILFDFIKLHRLYGHGSIRYFATRQSELVQIHEEVIRKTTLLEDLINHTRGQYEQRQNRTRFY